MFDALRALAFGSVSFAAIVGLAQSESQSPSKPVPSPGARGNADNVPNIGGKDAKGNPVQLAKSTGHVSNYSEVKIPSFTLPDP